MIKGNIYRLDSLGLLFQLTFVMTLTPLCQQLQQHHASYLHRLHIKTVQVFMNWQPLLFEPILANMDTINNVMTLTLCCLQWWWCHTDCLHRSQDHNTDINMIPWYQCHCASNAGTIILIIYMGCISISDKQLLINSLFCFSQCLPLCHDTDASDGAVTLQLWCQQWWWCILIIYIYYTLKLGKKFLIGSLLSFSWQWQLFHYADICTYKTILILWCQ